LEIGIVRRKVTANVFPILMTRSTKHHSAHNPTASISRIKTAICARFAASATRLKSLKNGDVPLTSLTLRVCWLDAGADCAGCDGWLVYDDDVDVDVDCVICGLKYCVGWDIEGEDSGAFIVDGVKAGS
jgi:hypothetical protein